MEESIFSESGHLPYFLVTDFCNVGCDFCMCKTKRNGDHLVLNKQATKNMRQLIKLSERIGISGQGDPIFNKKAVLNIISLGNRNKFEIMTSGNVSTKELIEFVNQIKKSIQKNKSKIKIRISLDRFHLSKIKHKNLIPLINYFSKNSDKSMELTFRSITIDKKFIKNYLKNELKKVNKKVEFIDLTPINSKLKVNGKSFNVDFQSIVNSPENELKDLYSPEEYILLLEKNLNKDFKLGNQLKNGKIGIDITINPNGEVLFYGLEFEVIGNILNEKIDYTIVKNFILNNKIYHPFFRIPYKEILKALRKNKGFSKMIDKINNPFWIMRNLYELDKKEFKKIIYALNK